MVGDLGLATVLVEVVEGHVVVNAVHKEVGVFISLYLGLSAVEKRCVVGGDHKAPLEGALALLAVVAGLAWEVLLLATVIGGQRSWPLRRSRQGSARGLWGHPSWPVQGQRYWHGWSHG